jgi:hypothetical protein
MATSILGSGNRIVPLYVITFSSIVVLKLWTYSGSVKIDLERFVEWRTVAVKSAVDVSIVCKIGLWCLQALILFWYS